jgi:hypothetical protein
LEKLRMKLFKWLLLSTVAFGYAAAEGQDAVMQPEVRLGDSWTYNTVTDPFSRLSRPETLTVTELSDTQIALSNGRKYTRTWDLLERPGAKYKRPWIYYKFPLAPGNTWQFESVFPSLRAERPGEVTMKLDCKVEGWEEVKVPAGTFKALKVVRKGTWTREGYSGPVLETSWYVPEIRLDVKQEYEDRYGGRIFGYGTRELVEFKPGQGTK